MKRNEEIRSILVEQKHDYRLPYPKQIVVAGMSSRRRRFSETMFRDLKPHIHSFDVEPESRAHDTLEVVSDKILTAHTHLPHINDRLIIGADVRTLTLNRQENDVCLISSGKPDSVIKIFEKFKEMLVISDITGQKPYYVIEGSSGLLHSNEPHLLLSKNTHVITISREGIEHLSTMDGFVEYLTIFNQIDSLPLHPIEKGRLSIINLSAGISLPTLVYMRYVDAIDGISYKSPEFYSALFEAMQIALVGISPEILQTVGIMDDDRIYHSEWIYKLVRQALRRIDI